MKKDLQSYHKHDAGYVTDKNLYSKQAIIERTELTNDFIRTGFGLALAITKNIPKVHIDIGCGVGWLVRKMSSHFTKSIGIEMSHAAIISAKKLTEDLSNVEFLEMDMVDGYKKLNPKEPVFFTTGAVLSHIENFYVEQFLKLINDAPDGSVLYFSENYDRNINWRMWHIRSKEWWRKHLPSWQLIFLDIENGGYLSGIYGIKMDKKEILGTYERNSLLWKSYWGLDMIKNILGRIIKKTTRILGIF